MGKHEHEGNGNRNENATKKFKTSPRKSRRTLSEWAILMDRICLWFVVFDVVACYVVLTQSVLKNRIPLPVWYYIDTSTGPLFSLTVVVDACGDFTGCLSSTIHMMLFIKLVLNLCAQLKVAASELLAIKPCPNTCDTKEICQLHRKERLRWAVIQHQRILKILEMIKVFYSAPLFVLFATVSADICCAVYVGLSVDEFDDRLSTIVLILINQLAQLCVYCWFGTMISHWATHIAEAAYDSAWVESDSSFRRSITIVMRQGAKPFVLTAGWFAKINLPSLAQILQDAGSYVMVMIALRDKINYSTGQTNVQ